MADQPTRVRFAAMYRRRSPLASFALRIGIAVGIVLVNWLIVMLESTDYYDSHDGNVSVVDALYYTTVTLTTTGYGDITPISTGARLVNALVVTPMRLAFVVLLVGTTLKALTRDSREEFRLARWRKRMADHIVVLGYGTKGRNAVRALVRTGTPASKIVVLDSSGTAVASAASAGYTAVIGAATDEDALRQALVDRARTVVIAVDRDDTAILATLTVRRLAPSVTVIAAAREGRNVPLLRQSGASSVIVSSETAGRLLGLATESPQTVQVLEDLLSFGRGLDIAHRDVAPGEVGRCPAELPMPVIAVVRDGRILHYNDPAAGSLLDRDRLIYAESAKAR